MATVQRLEITDDLDGETIDRQGKNSQGDCHGRQIDRATHWFLSTPIRFGSWAGLGWRDVAQSRR